MSTEFTNPEKDLFRDAYTMYQQDGEEDRLNEKYRPKSFYEENRTRRKVASVGTYLLNALSVATGFYFIFKYLEIVLPYLYISIPLAVILLAFWEYGKRESINRFIFQKIGRAWFSVSTLIASIFFIAGSIFFSYSGGKDLIKDFTYSPPLENIDSIEQYYEAEIAALTKQRESLNNSQGETIYKSATSAGLVDEKLAEMRTLKVAEVNKAKLKNETNTAVFTTVRGVKAEYFGIASGLCDLFLCVLFIFIEYSDKRVCGEMQKAKEANSSGSEPSALAGKADNSRPGVAGEGKTDIPDKSNSPDEIRTRVRSSPDKRLCPVCQTDMSDKRKDATACSESCRKKLKRQLDKLEKTDAKSPAK